MIAKTQDTGQFANHERDVLIKISQTVTPLVLATLPSGVPSAEVARKALQEWGGDVDRRRHVRWLNGYGVTSGPYESTVSFDEYYAMAYRSSDGRHSTVEIID